LGRRRKDRVTNYLSQPYGRRNPYFEALLKEGTNTSPIGAHSQGMSRLAFALLAGLERNDLDQREREARAAALQPLGGMPFGAKVGITARRIGNPFDRRSPWHSMAQAFTIASTTGRRI
jgi:hypothetical protein